jgi:peptidoglycan/xylan/chitin deacetylase (PgdA/CDA1 family)
VPEASLIEVCFHGVGRTLRKLETDEWGYWVGAEQFLRLLDEVAGWPSVGLSFDDGNLSDIEHAMPALRERELSATFFVLAGRLDQRGSLSTGDVAELRRNGMSVGSHGMVHRSWRGMDERVARVELDEAKAVISKAARHPVVEAACPFGLYDRRSLAQLAAAGFSRVHTSDRRRATARSWIVPRYSVYQDDSVESLRANVLHEPTLRRRLRQEAAGIVKRWR